MMDNERRMTTEERRTLRQALIDLDFRRVDYTRDDGKGRYIETFARGDNSVQITWGPKEVCPHGEPMESRVVGSLMCAECELTFRPVFT